MSHPNPLSVTSKKKNLSDDFEKVLENDVRDFSSEILKIESEIHSYLELLKKEISEEQRIIILNFLIIRTITFFELSMTALARDAISNRDPDLKLFFTDDWKIPLSKIDTILNSKLSKSAIITSNFNFQNIEDIDTVFSKLLRLDFVDSVQQLPNISSELKSIKDSKNNFNKFNFNDLFEKRHLIVHSHYSVDVDKELEHVKGVISVISFVKLSLLLIMAIGFFHKSKLEKHESLRDFIHSKIKERNHTK